VAERARTGELSKTGVVTSLLAAIGTMGLVEDLISWRDTFQTFWSVWDHVRVLIFKFVPFQIDKAFQEVLVVSWIYAGFLTRVLATRPRGQDESIAPMSLWEQTSLFVIISLGITVVAEVTMGRSIHRAHGAGDLQVHFLLFGAQGVFFLVMAFLLFAFFQVADRGTRRVAAKSMAWTTVGVFLLIALGAKLH
jgi:hypothetical protein